MNIFIINTFYKQPRNIATIECTFKLLEHRIEIENDSWIGFTVFFLNNNASLSFKVIAYSASYTIWALAHCVKASDES